MNRNQRHVIVISPLSFLYLLLTIAIIWAVVQILGILVSLFAAAIFATALNPAVNSIEKRLGIRRGLAVVLIVVLFFLGLAIIGFLILPTAISQAHSIVNHWQSYQAQIQGLLANQPTLLNAFNHSLEAARTNSDQIATHLGSWLATILASFFGVLTFFVFLVYLLVSGKQFATEIAQLVPNRATRQRVLTVAHDVSYKLGYWLRGQAVLCLIIFVMSFIVLTILGVPYALILALITGLFEAVPMVGAYLGAILPILVAVSISPTRAILVALAYLLIQQIEGNVFVPLVMKQALGIHPLIILLAALIGGSLFGFFGILVAVPVTAAASVIFESVKEQLIERTISSRRRPQS